MSLHPFRIGPFYFPPHLLTKGENKTTLLKFTEITLHYRSVSPANGIVIICSIIVKSLFLTMLSFELSELLWPRRVWHHDWQGSFRLGLRVCSRALCSRSRCANAWYCNGPRNRPRCLWRLEAPRAKVYWRSRLLPGVRLHPTRMPAYSAMTVRMARPDRVSLVFLRFGSTSTSTQVLEPRTWHGSFVMSPPLTGTFQGSFRWRVPATSIRWRAM